MKLISVLVLAGISSSEGPSTFKESKVYNIDFKLELEKGEVVLELLDAKKQVILSLNKSECSKIKVESRQRYYMVIRFKSATGNYEVIWE